MIGSLSIDFTVSWCIQWGLSKIDTGDGCDERESEEESSWFKEILCG